MIPIYFIIFVGFISLCCLSFCIWSICTCFIKGCKILGSNCSNSYSNSSKVYNGYEPGCHLDCTEYQCCYWGDCDCFRCCYLLCCCPTLQKSPNKYPPLIINHAKQDENGYPVLSPHQDREYPSLL